MKYVQYTPDTLLEAVRYFSDLDMCHEYMIRIRWPQGEITCPKCGGTRIGNIRSRRMLQCKDKECRKQFSTKVGTIFEDSPLGLDKWFVAVWSITNAKNGVSSHELARSLGVTQKSAWFMLHRIRLAMKSKTFLKIKGEIESDETFVGGKSKNMHKDKKGWRGGGSGHKTTVHGLLERGGDVRCTVASGPRKNVLQPIVRENVEPGSAVYTDQLKSYEGLDTDYMHKTINHIIAYVEGQVHTNGLENFWSLLKRSLGGTYVSVSPYHLQRYVDEQVLRFNARKYTDRERFVLTMSQVTGRRIEYKDLICGQDDDGYRFRIKTISK